MATDPFYEGTLMTEGTVQAELIFNEYLGRIHCTLGRVNSWGDTTPPGSPSTFDAYIVGTGATGDWSGQDDNIAVYLDGWKFASPKEGMRVRVADEDITIEHDSAKWVCVRGYQTLTDGANIAWDTAKGKSAEVTLGGNRTFDAPSNVVPGQRYVLIVKQDGTGSRTITWNAKFRWPGGSAPTLSSGASDVDVFEFVGHGTNEVLAVASAGALNV